MKGHIHTPRFLAKFSYHLTYILGIPLFAMLFSVFYDPTFNQPAQVVQLWTDDTPLCVPIVCSILLGVLVISRTILCLYRRRRDVTMQQYVSWQLLEFMLMGFFCTLFLSLHYQRGYFDLLPVVLLYGLLILILPYLTMWFFTKLRLREEQLHQAEQRIEALEHGLDQNEAGSVRFMDEKGNVKLAVTVDRIIYIESAGNYANILYSNDGKLVRYALRNTLKGIEECCAANGLVRCHRSYFVNLRKVKLLRRDAETLLAEIDHPGVDPVPVSKTYASEVMRLFAAAKQ